MKNLFVVYAVVFILVSCIKQAKTVTNESLKIEHTKKLDTIVRYNRVKTFECFKERFADYTVSGGTVLINTPKDNFYKYTALSDTEFVFSCGKDEKEVLLRQYNCKKSNRLPTLIYEDYGVLIFREVAGSDSWRDDIVDLVNDTVYSTQSYYIDTVHLRYVEMVYSNQEHSETNFLIQHIKEKYTDTLKTNYHKFRKDGDPFLFITISSLDDKKLYYSVRMEDEEFELDTLELH